MPGRRVFLDANVIIESFRIDVWGELSRALHLETVDACLTEALTGRTSRPDYVHVDAATLRQGLRKLHPVSRADRNRLMALNPAMTSLDPGERDLFAHLHACASPLPPLIVIGTADKGAMVRANDLGWLEHLVALEDLLAAAGTSAAKRAFLGPQHTNRFLSEVRTKIRLGVIP